MRMFHFTLDGFTCRREFNPFSGSQGGGRSGNKLCRTGSTFAARSPGYGQLVSLFTSFSVKVHPSSVIL